MADQQGPEHEVPAGRWQIGDVTISRIVELQAVGGLGFILPMATEEVVAPIEWMKPHFMTDDGELIASIHALVIDTPSKTIVVDTCVGNDKTRGIPNWNDRQGPFLDDLATAGYDRTSVDTVVCTHLHVDHVGWNTMLVDGEWVPTFPNARYLMGRTEFEFWDAEEEDRLNAGVMDDSVRPVVEAGLVDLVASDHVICDEVRLVPTPGHTKGHVSVEISSGGDRAVITGDAFHHPVQIQNADWASAVDFDQGASTATRQSMLEAYGDTDVLVIGTHFATPSAGRIRSGDDGHWLDVGV